MMILTYLCLHLFGLAAAKPSRVGIVNGTDVDIADNPWMALLFSKYDFVYLGGILISPNWVLTAGISERYKDLYQIRVGSSSKTDDKATIVEMAEFILHPNYTDKDDHRSHINNLALIRLKSPVNGTNIAPIALPELNAPVPEGQFINMAGWGDTTDNGNIPDHLQGATIEIIPIETCIENYAATGDMVIKEKEFCAGTIGDITGGCGFDAGGPAEINGTLIGMYVWSKWACSINKKPSVFVNVAYYRDWIQNVTGI